jgi:uncharacterized protein
MMERLVPAHMDGLRLHGVRNLAYVVMFVTLGWSEPHAAWTVALIIVVVGELIITLWDFVEEDRTRRLPASVTHTLLTLNYGIVRAMLAAPDPVGSTADRDHGSLSWSVELALWHRRYRCWRVRLTRSRRCPADSGPASQRR